MRWAALADLALIVVGLLALVLGVTVLASPGWGLVVGGLLLLALGLAPLRGRKGP